MSIIVPLIVAFLAIGLFGERLDARAYLLMLSAIVLVTIVRFVKG